MNLYKKVHKLYIHTIIFSNSQEKRNRLKDLVNTKFDRKTTFNSPLKIYDVPEDFDIDQFQLKYQLNRHSLRRYGKTGHIFIGNYVYCIKEKVLVYFNFDTQPSIELSYPQLLGYWSCSGMNGPSFYIHRENNGHNFIHVEAYMFYDIVHFYKCFKQIYGTGFEFNISNYPIIKKSQINLSQINLSYNYEDNTVYLKTDLNIFPSIIQVFPREVVKELLNIVLTSKFENNDPFGKDLAWRTVIDRYYGDMFRDYFKTNVSENDGEQLLRDIKRIVK